MARKKAEKEAPKTKLHRSDCPVAFTLNAIGDRWTLLIIRDLFKGKKKYGEFLDSAEEIPTNILANRLKNLEENGVLEKMPYSEHPPRFEYSLTPKGQELGHVLKAAFDWGNAYRGEKGK